jgi:hypothetical protein
MTTKTAVIYNANGIITLTGTVAESTVVSWAEANAVASGGNYIIVDNPIPANTYMVQNGQLVPISQVILNDQQWNLVRYQRDKLLSETDWHVTKAVETGQPIDQDWANYRQQLRDVTDQPDPFNIVWPTPPDSGGFNPTE